MKLKIDMALHGDMDDIGCQQWALKFYIYIKVANAFLIKIMSVDLSLQNIRISLATF